MGLYNDLAQGGWDNAASYSGVAGSFSPPLSIFGDQDGRILISRQFGPYFG
jgi:hypothetical protein